MLRRTAFTLLTVFALAAGRAEAVTIRDVIELTKAGLSDQVLLALIEVDRSVFAIDPATIKQLKQAGVSDPVIVALIRSGRNPPVPEPVAEPAPMPYEPQPRPEPQVIVIDHHDAPAQAYPVGVPMYLTSPGYVTGRGLVAGTGLLAGPGIHNGLGPRLPQNTITTTLQTDVGLMKARLPLPANCVKAQPVYWGFGGSLRPDSWQPPPTVLCR
jgi:hypothetical protein